MLLRDAGLPGRPRTIGSGYCSVAYRDGGHVLRVLRPGVPDETVAGYEREPGLLALLAARGLAVPREARVLRDASGRPLATLHRYIEGKPASAAGPGGSALRGRARSRLAGEIGGFLAALHRVPAEDALALGLRSVDLGREIYAPLVTESLSDLGPGTRAWVAETLGDFLREGGSERAPRALVHGDISATHLLASPAGALRGVIDWGDAMVADPALDLAGLLSGVGRAFRPPFLRRVVASYARSGPAAALIAGDPGLRRRIRFYLALEPLYQVRYGWMLGGSAGEEQVESGRRRLAARAARSGRGAPGSAEE